jgi:hypothetical protein
MRPVGEKRANEIGLDAWRKYRPQPPVLAGLSANASAG